MCKWILTNLTQGVTGGGGRNTPSGFTIPRYRNRDKLRTDGPLSSYADLTLLTTPCFGSYHRLFAVLMMPTSTTQEKQKKIRDIKALGRWYANALSPNEGFAGTLKPDYVGYHHNSYYASAYTPHALHKAALIQYLLSDTAFAFGENYLSTKGQNISPFSVRQHFD